MRYRTEGVLLSNLFCSAPIHFRLRGHRLHDIAENVWRPSLDDAAFNAGAMHRSIHSLPEKELLALGACWTSSLVTAGAIAGGTRYIATFLILSATLWIVAASWLGEWALFYWMPILKFSKSSPNSPASRLARPMMQAALILLSQAFLAPFYRVWLF